MAMMSYSSAPPRIGKTTSNVKRPSLSTKPPRIPRAPKAPRVVAPKGLINR